MRRFLLFILFGVFLLTFPMGAFAVEPPDLSQLINQTDTALTTRMVGMIGLLTVLSLAPGLLIMVTSFTRIIVVFSFLRAGIGLQTTPANIILISLALFMTFAIMGKPFDQAWKEGLEPFSQNKITPQEAFGKISFPFKKFMLQHVRDKDLKLFEESFGASPAPKTVTTKESLPTLEVLAETTSLRILVPAFMISELRRGFEIGFLIVLPFLIIDLAVATLTMSMGMMMLPPTVLSLPFKILFFVLMDGWNLLVGSLVRSFQ